MSTWSGLDFFIFLIFLMNTLLGMSRGASKEIMSMISLCVALVFTIKFTIPLTNFINSSPLLHDVLASSLIQNFMQAIGAKPLAMNSLVQLAYCVSMWLCFASVYSLCEMMISIGGVREAYSFPYAAINRKLSTTFGATRGYIISLILITTLQHLLLGDPIRNSYFVTLFEKPSQVLDNLIIRQNPDKYYELFGGANLYNAEDVLRHVTPPINQERLH